MCGIRLWLRERADPPCILLAESIGSNAKTREGVVRPFARRLSSEDGRSLRLLFKCFPALQCGLYVLTTIQMHKLRISSSSIH